MKTSNYYKFSYRFLSCFIIFYCTLSGTLTFDMNKIYAQTSQDTIKKQPLHVVSDKMIAKKDTSMVEFIGNVEAKQEDSTLLADSIKIYFIEDKNKSENKTKSDEGSNIKKIISTGNVRYQAGERKAFADKAVYTAIDDTLILTGKSAKLITGSSFVTGKKITYFRKEDKVIVESGGNNRVEALFNPEDTNLNK